MEGLAMKKTYTIMLATLSLAALCSCGKEGKVLPRTPELIDWTFEAPATRATFDERGKFAWEAWDTIDVWDAASGSFTVFTTVTGSGIFYAKAPADSRFAGAAYHPSGIARDSSMVNVSGEARPLCAVFEEGSSVLHFKHIGAYVTIDVRNIVPEAVALEISSPEALLDGDARLVSGVWAAAEGAGSVRFPVTEAFMTVTIPIPVGSYSLGYRIVDSEGEALLQACTDGAVAFERAHSYYFPPEDFIPVERLTEITVELEDYTIEESNDDWQ